MAREPGRAGCAAESVARGEPLRATASRVTRWLLIEQPGPWGREALLESRLEPRVAHTLRSKARRLKVRVVLIRRPTRREPDRRRAYLVRTHRDASWAARYDVDSPDELEHVDLSLLDGAEPPPDALPAPSTVRLVCTNGRHDPCCADNGRPVVRALVEEGVEEVWESSHVGGDRFAANLVFLPQGIFYGRVPPEDAGRLIREVEAGSVDLTHYRGRCCDQPLVQAAEIFLRAELGERRLDALRLVASATTGADTATVSYEHLGQVLHARVRREPGPPEHLTCTDTGEGRPWQYRLVGVDGGGFGGAEAPS
jgi:hypothetical protein